MTNGARVGNFLLKGETGENGTWAAQTHSRRALVALVAVDGAIGKYLDDIPLERQVRIMRRGGFTWRFTEQLDGFTALYQPVYEALRGHTLRETVVYVAFRPVDLPPDFRFNGEGVLVNR